MNKATKTTIDNGAARQYRRPAAAPDHKPGAAAPLADHRRVSARQQGIIGAMDTAPQSLMQRRTRAQLNQSPAMILQRRRIESTFGRPAQRREAAQEEALLQGKFGIAQRQSDLDDEELPQGRFDGLQRRPIEGEEALMQGKFQSSDPGGVARQDGRQHNRTGLPDQLKAGIESLANMDLSDVRVHRNSAEPARLNALAYAQGNDIHLGPGQERHLPHETWHVVQQRQARVKPTMQLSGEQINDDVALENEADVMGARASHKQGR